MEYFFYGLVLGYFSYPFWQTLTAIINNAWNATSACTGDCNQGRNCDCESKSSIT